MSESDSVETPANTMWERAEESEWKIWFLVTANRRIVTATITVGTFLLLLLLAAFGTSGVEKIVEGDAVGTVFGSVIIAIVTSVTLVLTVAQLVLSEQIDELAQHQSRMEGEIEFRERIEELSDASVAPSEPAEFLQLLVGVVERRAERIESAVREGGSEPSSVLTFTESVVEHCRTVEEDLDGAEFGTFGVLMPVLNFNYSWKLQAAQALRSAYEDDLSNEALEEIDELIRVLRFFAPAREYFKSQYFQWEIINVSRATLYGAMPALAVAGYMVFAFDAGAVDGSILGFAAEYVVVSAVYAVALLPFVVLLAYVLRILTVLKRTLAIGPFILRETETTESLPGEE